MTSIAWISLGKGKRIDFVAGLEAGEVGNRRDQLKGYGGRKYGER